MHESMKRLQEVAKTNRNSDIARDLNVGASTVTNWASRGVSKEGALKAADHYGSNANYILEGQSSGNQKSIDRLNEILEKGEAHTAYIDGDIDVPIYAVYFCCGDGNGSCDFEEVKGYRSFPASFFAERNIKPKNFKLVCATNDSMEPYINEHDEVGIDISDTEITDGGVYAILLENDRMIKQIFIEPGGALRLHSFNSRYPDKLVTKENGRSLIIVGKQVYRAG